MNTKRDFTICAQCRDTARCADEQICAAETTGGGNVFADLGLPEPELHLEIARLRGELDEAVELLGKALPRVRRWAMIQALRDGDYEAARISRGIDQWLAKQKGRAA